MSGIVIYMEGGGTPATRAALRQGMNSFLAELQDLARTRSWNWKLVCCGDRDRAFKAFNTARKTGGHTMVVLLVDAEDVVRAGPCAHLAARDRWNLADIKDDAVHLMVQTMETWIVADPENLQDYYGQHFNGNALPKARNLETVDKSTVSNALKQATRGTQKGVYHKIRHASDLLKRIDPQSVRAKCPGCKRLFAVLRAVIQGQGVSRSL